MRKTKKKESEEKNETLLLFLLILILNSNYSTVQITQHLQSWAFLHIPFPHLKWIMNPIIIKQVMRLGHWM